VSNIADGQHATFPAASNAGSARIENISAAVDLGKGKFPLAFGGSNQEPMKATWNFAVGRCFFDHQP